MSTLCRVCASYPVDCSRVCEECLVTGCRSWQMGIWYYSVGDLLWWRGSPQRQEAYRGKEHTQALMIIQPSVPRFLSVFFFFLTISVHPYRLVSFHAAPCSYVFSCLFWAEGEILWNRVPTGHPGLHRASWTHDPLHELWPQEETFLQGYCQRDGSAHRKKYVRVCLYVI